MLRVLNTTVIVHLICRTPKSALNAYEIYMVGWVRSQTWQILVRYLRL